MAKKTIQQAQAKLATLKPQANALIAQMQLEDAQIKAALLEEEECARRLLEMERRREINKLRAEEQQRLAEERRKKHEEERIKRADEGRIKADQRNNEREEKERR